MDLGKLVPGDILEDEPLAQQDKPCAVHQVDVPCVLIEDPVVIAPAEELLLHRATHVNALNRASPMVRHFGLKMTLRPYGQPPKREDGS